MGWLNDIKDAFETVADKVADGVTTGVNTVGDGVKTGINTVGDGVKTGIEKTGEVSVDAGNAISHVAQDGYNWTKDQANSFGGATVSAWEATSEEARAIGSAVEGTGMTIGSGFIAGANAVKDGLEYAQGETVQGLVSLGKYVSQYACDIAIGSALSAAFVALASDGQEEAAVGAIAVAANLIDDLQLKTAARTLAKVVAGPVYVIPGVSSAVGHKDLFEDIVAFIIFKATKQNPKVVVGTAGQFLAGALITGITSLVCEGKLPGGFEAWQGINVLKQPA